MKKILAIDDQEDNLIIVKAVIKRHIPNCKVLTSLSGKEGIEIAKEQQPDTILLDIIMPQMDGFEVCKKLKEDDATKHIPVLMITAIKTDSDSRVKGLNLGADAFLSKPIDPVELSAQVRVMLRIKEAEDKLRAEKVDLEEIVVERTNELKVSEEKYRALYDNAPLSYHSLDKEGCFLDVNPTWLSTLGYEEEDVIGKCFAEFLHPDYKPQFEKNFETFKKCGYIHDINYKIRHKDGHYLNILFEGKSCYHSDGSFKQTYCVFQDITERKKAEEKLSESKERYDRAMNATKDGVFDWNLLTNEIYYSPGWKSMLGYKDDELPNEFSVWENLTEPEDVKKSWKIQNELINKERDRSEIEFRMKHKDGHWVEVLARAEAVFDESGKAVRIVGTHTDITDHKKAEEALRESEDRFHYLADASMEAIFFSKKGICQDTNQVAVEIFGFKERSQIIGTILTELVAEESKKSVRHNILNNIFEPYEAIGKRRDGTEFPISIRAKSMSYKDEGIVRVTSVMDITERKQAEKELQESEEKYRAIVENSHDAIYIYKGDKFIFVNDKTCELSGYTRKEFHKMIIWDLIHPDDRKRIEEYGKKRITGKKVPDTYHARVIAKNGEMKNCEFAVRMIRYKNDFAVLGAVQDITERKQAEAELRESEEKYRSLFTSANDAIFLMQNDQFIACNPKTLEMFACKEDEIVGHSPIEFSPEHQPDGRFSSEKAMEKINNALDGKPQVFEWLHQQKDGSPFNTEVSLNKITLSDGEYIHAIVRDVTERKLAEETLRENFEKQNLVLNSLPIVFYTADPNNDLATLWINEQVETITGYQPSEMIEDNQFWTNRIHLDDKAQTLTNYFSVLETGYVETQYRWKVASGSYKWFQDIVVLLRDEHKRPKQVIGLWVDVTAKVESDELLRESEERYRLISEVSSDYVFSTRVGEDGSLNLNWVAGAYERMTGYSFKDSVKRDRWRESLSPIHQAKDDLDMQQLYNNKKVVSELQTIRKDGSSIWIESSAHPVWDKQKQRLVGIYGAVRDITARKQAEEALKKSEQQYRNFFEKDISGDYLSTPQGKLIDCNPAFANMLGYNKEEIMEMNTKKLYPHPTDRKAFLKKLIHKKHLIDDELDLVRKDGRIINCIENVVGTFDDKGVLIQFQGYVMDITKRKKAEEAVRESEEKYRAIVENSHDAIYIYKGNNFVFVNDKTCELLGYSREEFHNMIIWDLIHPDDRKRIEEYGKKRVAGEKVPDTYYAQVIAKNGDVRNCEFAVRMIHYQNDFAVLGAVRDITDRQKAEEALLESEKKYRTMIERSNDMIWAMDTEGCFTFFNTQVEETTGFLFKDWKGKPFAPLVFEEELPFLQEIFVNGMKGKSSSYEFRLKILNGKVLTLAVNTAPTYSDKKISGLVSFARDITDQKQAEENLIKRNKELQIFYDAAVGRELKVVELKNEINEILEKSGKKTKYKIPV